MLGELWAIRKAVAIAIFNNISKVIIITDSITSCQILNSSTTKNYCAAHIHMYIHNKISNSTIQQCHFIWSPGHVGLAFNEKADIIAICATIDGNLINIDLTSDESTRIICDRLYLKYRNLNRISFY